MCLKTINNIINSELIKKELTEESKKSLIKHHITIYLDLIVIYRAN